MIWPPRDAMRPLARLVPVRAALYAKCASHTKHSHDCAYVPNVAHIYASFRQLAKQAVCRYCGG